VWLKVKALVQAPVLQEKKKRKHLKGIVLAEARTPSLQGCGPPGAAEILKASRASKERLCPFITVTFLHPFPMTLDLPSRS
jgi:hypothetical protein